MHEIAEINPTTCSSHDGGVSRPIVPRSILGWDPEYHKVGMWHIYPTLADLGMVPEGSVAIRIIKGNIAILRAFANKLSWARDCQMLLTLCIGRDTMY